MITDHSIAAALRLEPYPAPWEKPLSLELALTECYRAHRDAPAAQREAACLRIQLPAMMQPMQPGDTFAGRIRYPLVGLSPEPMGLGWYCLADPIRKILDAAEHAPEHTPGHAAEHAAEHVPGHASEHASEHATEHPPEHVPGHTSEHTSEHAPEHAPEHAATEHATTFALTAADRARIETMLAFWKTETTHAKVRAAYPDDVRRILPEDDWPNHPGAAFPLYRMAGITLDNEKLLRLGLPGLAALLTLTTPPPTSPSPSARACPLYSSAFATFDKSALAILETLSGICRRYAAQARALNQPETAAALEAITTRAPQTMREAIQLFWLVTLASGVCNYGRMDVWLGPFLARDLAAGTLTRASALALLQALWRHIATAYDNMFNNRIVIGGLGRPDEAAADQFALLAIEATRTVTLNQPQLTLRFHAAQNPALMQAALASIGEGRTFPMLYNDDVNIPAVASAFNVPAAEAATYFPYGCGEYILDHRTTGTPNGLINLLKILEDTLRGFSIFDSRFSIGSYRSDSASDPASDFAPDFAPGTAFSSARQRAIENRESKIENKIPSSPTFAPPQSLHAANFSIARYRAEPDVKPDAEPGSEPGAKSDTEPNASPERQLPIENRESKIENNPASPTPAHTHTPAAPFPTFESLWSSYAAAVSAAVAALARQEKITYEAAGDAAPFLLISLLFDDCLERGKPIFSGGARRLGGTLESYGNINTADSLVAIRRLVYEQRACTLDDIVRACDDNFASPKNAALRRQLLDAPKFGNDDDEADALAARVHEHVCAAAREQAARAGLDHYHVVIINNGANTVLGKHTAASPDGRAAGEPMANAINPSPGLDRNGVTAFLNSLLKINPAIHAGSVQNMKFARALFSPANLAKTAALLDGWFAAGGTQAMITVVNRGDLENAMREPEKWGHLIVRVGGFSMRFIDLSRDIQLEILARTLNE